MRTKKVWKAAMRFRNIILLIAVIIAAYLSESLPFLLLGLAGYVYFVMQTMKDEKFNREQHEEEKYDLISQLDAQCQRLFHELQGQFDKEAERKIRNVLQEKQMILDYFQKDRDNPLKRKIAEQVLNLVIAYVKLYHNYSVQKKDLSFTQVNELKDRINHNNRRLGLLKDYEAVLELSKSIEMDEKLLLRIEEEKDDVERIYAKLEYIDSTIDTFKHRIISNQSDDEVLQDIETIVNEATALDTVLTERKDRMRL